MLYFLFALVEGEAAPELEALGPEAAAPPVEGEGAGRLILPPFSRRSIMMSRCFFSGSILEGI